MERNIKNEAGGTILGLCAQRPFKDKEKSMKKVIVLCLIAAMLLLSGCTGQTPLDTDVQTKQTSTTETSTNSDKKTEDVDPLQCFGYTETDIDSVIFTDIQKGITVDLSANNALKDGLMNLQYDPAQAMTEAGEAVYELKINGKSLYVYPENVAAYDGSALYTCQGFDALAYLGGVFAGEQTQLGGFSADATVKIQNAKGLVAKVEDNEAFFTELGKATLIKLSNAADYSDPSAEYTVLIGDDCIKICNGYLSVGEDLYAITGGSFDFLSEYAYSSSSEGFLPWI